MTARSKQIPVISHRPIRNETYSREMKLDTAVYNGGIDAVGMNYGVVLEVGKCSMVA
jgi:hypothetical protein